MSEQSDDDRARELMGMSAVTRPRRTDLTSAWTLGVLLSIVGSVLYDQGTTHGVRTAGAAAGGVGGVLLLIAVIATGVSMGLKDFHGHE